MIGIALREASGETKDIKRERERERERERDYNDRKKGKKCC